MEAAANGRSRRGRTGEPAHSSMSDLADGALADLALPPDATWNWLGVTVYLPKLAIAVTLGTIAASGTRATVVADFALAPEYCDPLGRAWRGACAQFAASVGEPHLSTFAPDEVREMVEASGLRSVEVLDAAALGARYLRGWPGVMPASGDAVCCGRLSSGGGRRPGRSPRPCAVRPVAGAGRCVPSDDLGSALCALPTPSGGSVTLAPRRTARSRAAPRPALDLGLADVRPLAAQTRFASGGGT